MERGDDGGDKSWGTPAARVAETVKGRVIFLLLESVKFTEPG